MSALSAVRPSGSTTTLTLPIYAYLRISPTANVPDLTAHENGSNITSSLKEPDISFASTPGLQRSDVPTRPCKQEARSSVSPKQDDPLLSRLARDAPTSPSHELACFLSIPVPNGTAASPAIERATFRTNFVFWCHSRIAESPSCR